MHLRQIYVLLSHSVEILQLFFFFLLRIDQCRVWRRHRILDLSAQSTATDKWSPAQQTRRDKFK